MPSVRRARATVPLLTRVLTIHDDGRLTALDDALIRGFELALRTGFRPRLKSEKSIATYLHGVRHLVRFARSQGMGHLADLSRDELRVWMLALRASTTAGTAGLYLVAVRTFYAWLIDQGDREDDPTLRLTAPPLDRTLKPRYTLEQLEAIFQSQNGGTLIGLRNLALFTVLLDTGLRRGEVASLDVGDVDWKHGIVRVMGKGSKERKVRLGAMALRALDTYLRRRERAIPGLAALFHSQAGGRLTGSGMQTLHAELGARLGFHMHAHRWRHTAIQSWLDAGMEREDVRVLAGHETLQTLKTYTEEHDMDRALAAHRRTSPADQVLRKRRGH